MTKKAKKVTVKRKAPVPREEGADAVFPPKAYVVCCAHTTKRVHGGRSCQICKGFVANA